jgi:mannitol-1-/sugar-/sorbitol-6-phosphatase
VSDRWPALLFDLDGVLVDSTEVVMRHWRMFAKDHGLDERHVLTRIHGRRSIDSIRELLADRTPAEIEAAAAQLEARELAEVNGTVALPGAPELLARLGASPWAIVTSAPRLLASARLRAARLPQPRVIVSAEDVMCGKPDPQGYTLAATRLGAEPSRCIVLEDAPAGVAAGHAAGMRVAALTTTHTAEELEGLVAELDLIVPDLRAAALSAALPAGPAR